MGVDPHLHRSEALLIFSLSLISFFFLLGSFCLIDYFNFISFKKKTGISHFFRFPMQSFQKSSHASSGGKLQFC